MKTIAGQLDETAALLERGWVQKIGWEDIDGVRGYCLSGAMAEATGNNDCQYNAVLKFILEAIPNAGGIISWNDDLNRTQAEVVAVVRKAAELARAQS